MKCGVCGTKYAGDNKHYRCNSMGKSDLKCHNNSIAQNTAEEAIFLFITKHLFNAKNFEGFADRVRNRINKGQADVRALKKNLSKVQRQIDRAMKLYQRGTIDIENIEKLLVPLQEQKKAVAENIDRLKSEKGIVDVSEGQILDVLHRLEEEFRHADPKIRKRVCMTLIDEIRILPKQGTPWKWERLLEIKGVHVPLTRVNVVIPPGIEPGLPA
ncbi:MAG: zinc ribbon domain-containing protein [Desulfobacterales bacterium]|nr:zinc ribbon domain-containing protein [Desulfobacterales bacterium]